MAGGDLDGDVYMVLWDESVLKYLTKDKIQKPAIVKTKEADPKKLPKEKEISKHLEYYFKNDILGMLQNLHDGLCDQRGPDGPMEPRCKELGQLISNQVDFAKHGVCTDKEEYDELKKLLKHWPDFMEKNDTEIPTR